MKFVKKILKTTLIVSLIAFTLICLLIGTYLIHLNKNLHLNNDLLQNSTQVVSVFNAQNEQIIPNSVHKINYSELNPYTIDAFISIEDKGFYKHHGLNYKRIAKALIKNIKAKNFIEGASTISQQLIKNTHLSQEKTINRKLNELILTKKLEKNYTKDEIMENYLNVIYFGNNSYGLEQASKNYFNKNACDLTISESATLAGLIKSPKTYSPIYNKENCLKRRNLVLREMFKDKKITKEEFEIAINQDLILHLERTPDTNKHYFNGAIGEASQILNLSEKDLMQGGYLIFTYQDTMVQKSLQNAVDNKNHYEQNKFGNTADSAAIVIDNETGAIIALGGKSDYDIVNMRRSPASAIKPMLVFAPALENGSINTLTPILDEKTDFNGYSPQNVGGYYGYVSPQKALEKSLNIPAVKILKSNGIKNSINFAKKAGFKFSESDNNLSIALGCLSNGVSLSELCGSYSTFANGGEYIKPKFVRKICKPNGEVIYSATIKKEKIMSSATAYLMTQMLINSVKNGTSKMLNTLPYEIAGKTGTVGIKNTNLNTDAISTAYTSKHTFVSWLLNPTGNKEYNLEGSNNGGTYASRMLKEIIEGTYQNTTPCNFAQPQDIVFIDIDINTLNNEHKVEKASKNTPQKDIISAPFNIKFTPTKTSKNYLEIKSINLKGNLNNSFPSLSFETSKLYKYDIYRLQEDTLTHLKTIDNSSSVFEYIDTSTKPNNFYSYYVVANKINNEKPTITFTDINSFNHSKIFNTKKENDALKSNIVKIYTKN